MLPTQRCIIDVGSVHSNEYIAGPRFGSPIRENFPKCDIWPKTEALSDLANDLGQIYRTMLCSAIVSDSCWVQSGLWSCWEWHSSTILVKPDIEHVLLVNHFILNPGNIKESHLTCTIKELMQNVNLYVFFFQDSFLVYSLFDNILFFLIKVT